MQANNVNIDKIRGLMAEKRIKQQDIANILGLHVNSVHLRMTGNRPFKQAEIIVLSDMLGCKPEDLAKR